MRRCARTEDGVEPMRQGYIYLWTPDQNSDLGGHVALAIAPLEHLTVGEHRSELHGRYARVRNGGAINTPDEVSGAVRAVAIGNARPNDAGDFIFEPGRGGGRLDKVTLAEPDMRIRYVQAAHFGETNTYFHLDRIALYIDTLLRELGAPSLPPVVAVVNAHHAVTEIQGVRDGVYRNEHWLPFQGGHYRLPSRSYDIQEREPLSPNGEIHLGPGWRLVEHGALVRAAGGRYRANAAHNAGIIYHEYGHHITRHTADFRANALCRPDRQNNQKTSMDEGTCDYWAATMLETPHIWAWHRRHDAVEIHPRSLTSSKTMAEYDSRRGADPHANGTIWGAALWDLRSQLRAIEPDGARTTDLLLLQALILIGGLIDPQRQPSITRIRRIREPFAVGVAALLQADALLYHARHHDTIVSCFARRGVTPAPLEWQYAATPISGRLTQKAQLPIVDVSQMQTLLKRIPADEIPASEELLSGAALAAQLTASAAPPFSLIVCGDIMIGGRTSPLIATYGTDYPFLATLPLLQSAPIVLGNLEGPFARMARKEQRNYSYRVHPALAGALAQAGFNVLTLANNHLLDCGRAGVLETLEALEQAHIAPLGAGIDAQAAHQPVIRIAQGLRIGFLGYYWNSRCAARGSLPGAAMDTEEALARDIGSLRDQVDRVVVTFHWGVPYERDPLPEDYAKAHFAVDNGADVIIGHHPHVVQPFELYRGAPIFYSVGNFTFGSGNSKAESLLLGIRFEPQHTQISVFPLYVKNRDPRVQYQPKVLGGAAAERTLRRLTEMSGPSGEALRIEDGRGWIDLPRFSSS